MARSIKKKPTSRNSRRVALNGFRYGWGTGGLCLAGGADIIAEMTHRRIFDEVSGLLTEQRNPRTSDLDRLPVRTVLERINAEDRLVAEAVAGEIPWIEQAVELVVAAFRAGGRLIYAGAGTSGRLGVLDAAECPPTFGTPPEMVRGIIAGGLPALTGAVEGAEDRGEEAVTALAELN